MPVYDDRHTLNKDIIRKQQKQNEKKRNTKNQSSK